jgi:hypothetical protein
MKRTLAVILISITLTMSGLFIFRAWLSRGEPVSNKSVTFQRQGTVKITINSLVEPISVEIDDERDLFTALGFSQALVSGDRMEFLRLSTQGDLAADFGKDYQAFDAYMKSWTFHERAAQTLKSLDAVSQKNLLDFIEGINLRYALIDLPSGCLWSRCEPDSWEAVHVMAVWHLLRWSQTENWPLYFLIRHLDIYYGKHVKEQFETALGMKIHDKIDVGHIRKIVELYEQEQEFRKIVGLYPVLDEHISGTRLTYGYSGQQNEDWIRLRVTCSGTVRSYVMHVGLPLFFAVNGEGVFPVSMRYVPLNPPKGEKGDDIFLSTSDMYGNNRLFDFGVPADLFDLDGNVFRSLMMKDSVVNHNIGAFSYGLYLHGGGVSENIAFIQSKTEAETNLEIVKILQHSGTAPDLTTDVNPLLLTLFRVKLMDRVYKDDLSAIHPVFAGWPSEFPSIFLKHFQMLLKNPYSAWWDKRETPDVTENMNDIIREIYHEIPYLLSNLPHINTSSIVKTVENPGHPLSRFHLFTGSWQYYPKEVKAPLVIKFKQDQFYFDRFYFLP